MSLFLFPIKKEVCIMVSAFTKVGLTLFILGFFLMLLIPVFGIYLPFMTESPEQSTTRVDVPNNGSYIDLVLAEGISHPFYIQIDLDITLHSINGGRYSGNMVLLYSNVDEGIFGAIPRMNTDFYAESGEDTQITRRVAITPKYTANSFDVILRLTGYEWEEDTCYLGEREIVFTYLLWAGAIPFISALLGIIIIIGGFIYNYRRMTTKPKRPRITQDVYEPSLGVTRSPETSAKPVTKTSGQQTCKNCGREVSDSLVYCPHCFGKL